MVQYHKWTQGELDILKDKYNSTTAKKLANILKISEQAIYCRVKILKLHKFKRWNIPYPYRSKEYWRAYYMLNPNYRASHKKYYTKNKEKEIMDSRRRYHKNRVKILEQHQFREDKSTITRNVIKGGLCLLCFNTNPFVLETHHFGDLEIILCASCHSIITYVPKAYDILNGEL